MKPMTRRQLIETATKGGLVLGAGGLLASCGATASSPSSQPAVGTPKRGGRLRAGLTGGSSSDTLDPNTMVNNVDAARVANLYDTLVWTDAEGRPELRLAEEMSPNKDATVWTIRLRRGVTFHDGHDLTADDLIFSIHRILDPKSPGQAASMLRGLGLQRIRKLDRYTVSVTFGHRYSTFLESQANNAITIYVLPTHFDPKRPIGTGPFKFVSFTPGQESVFARNESYWEQPLPYVDELVITDFSDESSQVNALLSGQVQAINLLSQDTVGTVAGSGKKVVVSPGGGWNPFTMRVDMAPFDDVRVRQAFRLMVDRPKMMQLVFGGHGTIGNDVFSVWSSEYDTAIPQRTQDIEQAKSLLKAAGRDGLTVQLVTANIAQGTVNMAQLFAQDAAKAGVNINLRQITVTEFYGPNYLKWQFAQDWWYYQPYFPQAQQATLPAGPFNETHFSEPRYNSLYQQALGTLDEAKRVEIAHEMQMIDHSSGGYIIPFFPPVIDGYAPNVNGAVKSKTGSSFNLADFKHMWLS